jgi:hypothetical protein
METTLNMDLDILKQITRAAQLKHITRSEMIILLMNKVMDNTLDPYFLGKMVQYQKRRQPGNWHRFHIQLRPDEYEFFLDLRKLLKMSVSLILAYAVGNYLQLLIRSKITDNYLHKNYMMIRELIDNIKCWKLYWGYPPGIEKLIM